VKTYVKNTCKKLHVRNRLEAVARFGHKCPASFFHGHGFAGAPIPHLGE